MTDAERLAHYKKMTETPVSRLIGRLAVPTIISMMVSALYNTADTFFVSMLGTSATGAVGIVFSIMAIIQAIGFTIGMGAGNILSRELGAKEDDKATVTASSGFFLALLLSIVLMIIGIVFTEDLMRLLGATETILPYAEDYAAYIFYGCPVMCCSFVMNNYLRAEGKAFFSMIGLTAGGVLNIVLDPIFIFVFGFGTAGAAMATALSQLISFIILLSFFLTGKSSVRIQITRISRDVRMYVNIIKVGLPTLMRQGLASIATIALNVQAAAFGDAAVAAMSISGRVNMFAFSAMLGFGQGFQPVSSFNYGAKRYDRVRTPSMDEEGTTRLFIARGRKDGLTKGMLCNIIMDHAGVRDQDIGDIEVLDDCSFISAPFSVAEKIIRSYSDRNHKGKPIVTRAKEQKKPAMRKEAVRNRKRRKNWEDDFQPYGRDTRPGEDGSFSFPDRKKSKARAKSKRRR